MCNPLQFTIPFMEGTRVCGLWLELLSKVQTFYSKQTQALSKTEITGLNKKYSNAQGLKNRCPQNFSHVSECFIFITMFYNLSETKMKMRTYTEGFRTAPLAIRQDIKTKHKLKQFKCYGFRGNCNHVVRQFITAYTSKCTSYVHSVRHNTHC